MRCCWGSFACGRLQQHWLLRLLLSKALGVLSLPVQLLMLAAAVLTDVRCRMGPCCFL